MTILTMFQLILYQQIGREIMVRLLQKLSYDVMCFLFRGPMVMVSLSTSKIPSYSNATELSLLRRRTLARVGNGIELRRSYS